MRRTALAIALPLLLIFIVLPLGLLFARSFSEGPSLYLAVLRSPMNRAALGNSLRVALGVAGVALLLGTPLGIALARLQLAGSRALGTLLVLPLAAPSYVWAMAWIALASPRAGWLNRLAGAQLFDIYGLPGIVFVEGLALFPLVLLPTRAALESADPSLEEAARIGGAGPLRAFLTGSFPLALPPAASGALLAFLASLSSFGVPYLLGVATERPALVATTRIYQALALGDAREVNSAIALCLILLVFAAAAQLLASRVRRSGPQGSGKGRRIGRLAAPGLARTASVLAWSIASLSVLLPVLAILLSALTRRYGEPPFPGNLTLGQFREVLGKREVREALLHSLSLALCAGLAVVALGALLAFLRRRTALGPLLLRLAEAPAAVPGSVLALALLFAFAQEVRLVAFGRVSLILELSGTLWLLGIAYAIKYLAFGARSADDALRALDPSLEEAARISGASAGQAFVSVALPLARPALLAAFILVFLPAATELTMSALLAGPRAQVLGTVLFDLASYADPPSAAVLACIVLLLAAAADLSLRRLGRLA